MVGVEANIAPFPSPAKGRVKDPTAALRQRRHRKRKSLRTVTGTVTAAVTGTVTAPLDQPVTALPTGPVRPAATVASAQMQKFENGNDFNGGVTVERNGRVTRNGKAKNANAVTPFDQPQGQDSDEESALGSRADQGPALTPIDLTAYAAALALAGVAAYFSIRGMTVLFPGALMAIVVMAATMEAAKLVTAGWLARRWRTTARVWRLVLVTLVAGLAVINATGVYAQLVAAHVGERGAAAAAIETQDAELAARDRRSHCGGHAAREGHRGDVHHGSPAQDSCGARG
jgi:hypothetical protein